LFTSIYRRPPLAYRAALEQLVDALRTLKREFDL
jgi:hypothetical protein